MGYAQACGMWTPADPNPTPAMLAPSIIAPPPSRAAAEHHRPARLQVRGVGDRAAQEPTAVLERLGRPHVGHRVRALIRRGGGGGGPGRRPAPRAPPGGD